MSSFQRLSLVEAPDPLLWYENKKNANKFKRQSQNHEAMMTSDEALGFARWTRELPLQEGRPNLLSLLFTHSCLLLSFKTLAAENVQSMQFMKKRGLGGGNIVKIHIHSFNKKISEPLSVQELLHSLSDFAAVQKQPPETITERN